MNITGGSQTLATEQVDCTAPILPVELLSFTGQLVDNKAVLKWTTASETNNEGFQIERSVDGVDWKAIGFVGGNGTTAEVVHYEFIDQSLSQNNYYRLKQLDYDGIFEYSNIVYLHSRTLNNGYRIFPNPANQFLTIEATEPIVIQIVNTNGQVLKEQPANSISTISIDDLPNGIYFLKAGEKIQKFIVQH